MSGRESGASERAHRAAIMARGRGSCDIRAYTVKTPPMTTPLVPSAPLDPVVAYFRPRRVILFGSRARGDDGLDSDNDEIHGFPPDRERSQARTLTGASCRPPKPRVWLDRAGNP